MNSMITDIVIHTKEELDDQEFYEVCKQAYRNDGVISLSRNLHAPRFLIVVYNAARIHSTKILDAVTTQGHQARLIGI